MLADDDALENLDTLFATFYNTGVHLNRITNVKLSNV